MQGSKIVSVRSIGIVPTFNMTMASEQHNYAFETNGYSVFSANSHAACYAFIGYQCAYLKYYYKIEFAAALLSTNLGNEAKLYKFEKVFERLGIRILPHDINKSKAEYSIEGGNLRRPLTSLKGLSNKSVPVIVSAQPFRDVNDFVAKVCGHTVNKGVYETLVNSGCMDCLGMTQRTMLETYAVAKDKAKNQKRKVELEKKKEELYGVLTIWD